MVTHGVAATRVERWRIVLYYCTVVPKRSRDSVSDDVAFRRPAVELLAATMHGWALPCHTKSGFRTPPSTSYRLKFLPRCFRRECQPYIPVATEFIIFLRSYGIFPHFAETSDPSNFLFFFPFVWCNGRVHVGVYQQNVAPNFQHLTLRFTPRKYTLSHLGLPAGPART